MTNNNCQNKYLYPSAIIVSDRPMIIKTVLGSCVSVCMYDKEKKIGGINHFMLPFWRGDELSSPKHGNVAMGRLLKKMLHVGANKESIIAKVFGGARLLNFQSDHYRIGIKNIEVAKKFLRENEIPIVASDAGGDQGRKILFNTDSGEVYLKRIDSTIQLISEEV